MFHSISLPVFSSKYFFRYNMPNDHKPLLITGNQIKQLHRKLAKIIETFEIDVSVQSKWLYQQFI